MDVYQDWLGIPEPNRPLNYYQLLRLKPFEDRPAVIRDHYGKLCAQVRKRSTAETATEAKQLLDELTKGMLCLTDIERKEEYDTSLGRKAEIQRNRRSFEELLLAHQLVPADRMKQIKSYADAVGIDLQEAVLQQKIADPEAVMLAYAESIGSPFIRIEDVGVDEEIARQINPVTARQHSFVPLLVDRGSLLLASPKPVNPDVEEELRMIFGIPVRCTICLPTEINAAIAKYYPRDAVQFVQTGIISQNSEKTPQARREKTYLPPRQLSDEEKRNRIMNSIVAFNFSVMIVCAGLYLLQLPRSLYHTWWHFPFLALAGITVGGVAALITWKKCSR
jgi:hypothetical protein